MQLYSINKRERFGKMGNGFLLLFGPPTPIAKFSITDSLIQIKCFYEDISSDFHVSAGGLVQNQEHFEKKSRICVPNKLYICSSSFKINKYTMQELKFALFAIYAKDCDFFLFTYFLLRRRKGSAQMMKILLIHQMICVFLSICWLFFVFVFLFYRKIYRFQTFTGGR